MALVFLYFVEKSRLDEKFSSTKKNKKGKARFYIPTSTTLEGSEVTLRSRLLARKRPTSHLHPFTQVKATQFLGEHSLVYQFGRFLH